MCNPRKAIPQFTYYYLAAQWDLQIHNNLSANGVAFCYFGIKYKH